VPTDPYASIDHVIFAWLSTRSFKLFGEWAGRPARFFYVSSAKGECFQISIQPPEGDTLVVDAWSIDTLDDSELHQEWKVSADQLEVGMDAALRKIHDWMDGRGR